MTKRYSRSRRRQGTPGWAWMLLGLTMGLLVAGYVWISDLPAPRIASAARQAGTPEPQPSPSARAPEPQSQSQTQTQTPQRQQAASTAAAARATPAAAPTGSDRFQFYETLPQSEVVVPEAGSSEPRASTARAPAPIEEPGSYMLQVGSFRSHADADRRKASIALLGYESQIQRATVNGDVVHRVLVGPMTDLATLDIARRRFRDENFDTLVLKAAK